MSMMLDYLDKLGKLESYLTYLSISQAVKRYIYHKWKSYLSIVISSNDKLKLGRKTSKK
ncbi:hypothetical protein GA0061081_101338 [Gilliamella bombicola]|uniref:Uncharacterized protein n=1 Tax=Gilliamella bombicola TaxID=1798182 RepID=A0A1C3ZCJ4_9GAMM|nr:hypothetical protein GA0061081_101338 [Gilliamella bombicola]